MVVIGIYSHGIQEKKQFLHVVLKVEKIDIFFFWGGLPKKIIVTSNDSILRSLSSTPVTSSSPDFDVSPSDWSLSAAQPEDRARPPGFQSMSLP